MQSSATMPSPSRPMSAKSGVEGDRNVIDIEDDEESKPQLPAVAAEEPTGAKMHRQFHARKQQLNLFLAAVAVLVTLAFMATLSNNGTLMEKQALQGRALDTFAVGGGEPTLADRFVHFIESRQKRCASDDTRWLVWQGAGPSFGDQLFSLASTFSWALSTGRVFTVLSPEMAAEVVHNWDTATPCWACYVAPLSTCPFELEGGRQIRTAGEDELEGSAEVVSFSRLSLNRAFVNGTVFEDQSELWITAQLFRYILRLSEHGMAAVDKEAGRVGWPVGEGEVEHMVVGVHTRVGDTVVYNPPKKAPPTPGKKLPQAAPHPLTAYAAAVKWVAPITGDVYVYIASAEVGVCDALTDILEEKVGDSVQVICQAELTKEEARRPEAVFDQWFVDLILLSRTNFLISCQSATTARAVYALHTARLAAAGLPVVAPFYDLDNAVWFAASVGDSGVATAAPKIWQAMQADIRSSIVQVSDLGAAPATPSPTPAIAG